MTDAPASSAGSVSKIECTASVAGREAKLVLYRHLSPITVNSLLRTIPFDSRVTLQPAMVCLFTQLRVGVEKPRTRFSRGDVAFLPSGGLICVFLGDAQSARPLNLIGKMEEGIDAFDGAKRGDIVRIVLASPEK